MEARPAERLTHASRGITITRVAIAHVPRRCERVARSVQYYARRKLPTRFRPEVMDSHGDHLARGGELTAPRASAMTRWRLCAYQG